MQTRARAKGRPGFPGERRIVPSLVQLRRFRPLLGGSTYFSKGYYR